MIGDLWVFLGASILLTLAPGPDILYVIAQSVMNGRRAGAVTALGLCSGVLVHTTAAAVGVSALFHASAWAFNLLKYAGVLYLLWLAWQALASGEKGVLNGMNTAPAGRALFRRGLVMNLLNPKVSLFFLAFLPQFAEPERGSVALQMILLGLVFMLQAVVIFCLVALLAGSMRDWLTHHAGAGRWSSWVAAGIYALLGLRLALTERL